jgi:hypothetical protein
MQLGLHGPAVQVNPDGTGSGVVVGVVCDGGTGPGVAVWVVEVVGLVETQNCVSPSVCVVSDAALSSPGTPCRAVRVCAAAGSHETSWARAWEWEVQGVRRCQPPRVRATSVAAGVGLRPWGM